MGIYYGLHMVTGKMKQEKYLVNSKTATTYFFKEFLVRYSAACRFVGYKDVTNLYITEPHMHFTLI